MVSPDPVIYYLEEGPILFHGVQPLRRDKWAPLISTATDGITGSNNVGDCFCFQVDS